MESVPISERAKNVKDLDLSFNELPIERALGIEWCAESDTFHFSPVVKEHTSTRRGILSAVASVFDPLGFLAPFVLRGKRILQEMCKKGTEWDDPLPDDLRPKWESWLSELRELDELQIRRCFKPDSFGTVKKIELHHFSDASLKGYGQSSYLRLVDCKDNIHCSLVMGKSRVAPLKPVTIPRLELQAALVSVQVSNFLNKELDYETIENFFWTDSKIVLDYLNNDARRFHIFVANRIQRIKESSQPEQWHYISTKENPADHASRGLGVNDMIHSNWFKGPTFLWDKEFPAPSHTSRDIPADDPELKTTRTLATTQQTFSSMIERIERFSKWNRAITAVAVLYRYIAKKRNQESATPGKLNRKQPWQ
ncbi:uncharacterized protein [Ptychodera flava]|uniref:uncharacterized protein n=1 Tax=Ptychodera flava TaxID=63121 RepID=UPI00396A8F84